MLRLLDFFTFRQLNSKNVSCTSATGLTVHGDDDAQALHNWFLRHAHNYSIQTLSPPITTTDQPEFNFNSVASPSSASK